MNWFDVPWDMDVQIGGVRLVRKIFESTPTSTLVVEEVLPGFDAVPANASDAQWAIWIQDVLGALNHPIGMHRASTSQGMHFG